MISLLSLWFLLSSPGPVQAADMVDVSGWEGAYTCTVDGQQRAVHLEFRDEQLKVVGLNLGSGAGMDSNDPLPCSNQKLTQRQGGAVYTIVSTCGEDGIYRALILDRPGVLEQFSMVTHIRSISATELNIHVKIKYTGTIDQDLLVNCRK